LAGGVELGLPVLGGREHSVEHHDVIVIVSVQGGAEPMEEGDGPESGIPGCPRARSAQCGANGTHEDPKDATGNSRVVVEERPQALGNGQHPLTHRKMRKHVVRKVSGDFGHAARVTRRANTAALA
jgi:hypothetical protein